MYTYVSDFLDDKNFIDTCTCLHLTSVYGVEGPLGWRIGHLRVDRTERTGRTRLDALLAPLALLRQRLALLLADGLRARHAGLIQRLRLCLYMDVMR